MALVSGKARTRALITLFMHLEQMEKAGVPLRDSLAAAQADAADADISRALAYMIEEVKSGRTLSESMEMHPSLFDPMQIRLVAAGEKSGKLARVLGVCLQRVKLQEEYARKLRKASLYPFVSGAIIMALAFFFRDNSAMPWMAAGFFGSWFLWRAARRYSPALKHATDYFILLLPVIGPLSRADSWARFASALALMFAAGLPLRIALGIAAECVPNLVIRRQAEEAQDKVVNGASLHQAFAGSADRMTLTMLKTGEDSGNLSATLQEVAGWHDRRTDDALTALHQLAGPALTIVTGGMLYFGFM